MTPTELHTPLPLLPHHLIFGFRTKWTALKKEWLWYMCPLGNSRWGVKIAGSSDEKPVHTVYLDTFCIDRYEVTNALYNLCVQAGNCKAQQW